MDSSVGQQETKTQPKTRFSDHLIRIINRILNWMLSPFLLTEEEKEQAGIYIGHMGEDD